MRTIRRSIWPENQESSFIIAGLGVVEVEEESVSIVHHSSQLPAEALIRS